MKILYLTNNLNSLDGWSRYSFDLINEVQAFGHEVLCLVNEKSEHKEIKQLSILEKPTSYLFNPFKSFSTSKKVKKIINDFSPDVVHVLVEPYISILKYIKKDNLKFILTIHGSYSVVWNLTSNFLKKYLALISLKSVITSLDIIISVSDFSKKYFLNNFKTKLFEKKVEVITNGISIDRYADSLLKIEKNNTTKSFLFVGAIKKRKGLLESLKTLSYYKQNYSTNFRYTIVGNYLEKDPYYKVLKNFIVENNLQENVEFTGQVRQEKLEEYYQKADLFLMLPVIDENKFEGFGLVYLEANLFGIPCIGSINSGASEAIIDGQTGFLVDSSNCIEIAEKIDLIINKKIILQTDCVEWAKNNDINKKVNNLINLYKLV